MPGEADGGDADLAGFGLFDPRTQQCPHRFYEAMRERCPVFPTDALGTTIHLITRHSDVADAALDHQRFSSNFGGTGVPSRTGLGRRLAELYAELGGYPPVGTMLNVDPPAQTRYRKLVSRAFTPRAIAALEPFIRATATDLIDGFIDAGSVEFVDRFAVPLPIRVIARALNVADDRLADFKRWSDASVAAVGTALSDDERIAAERSVIELQHYFADQIEQRRAQPRDDILTNLVEARIDRSEDPELSDEPLTVAEMLSIIQQLLVAGNETTTKMLSEMMRLFGEAPAEWHALRRDPARAPAAVDEVLRLATPVQGMWRVVTDDVEVAGTTLRAGSRVVVMYASANRDASVFDEPGRFDPGRPCLSDHLAFGRGIHYCLGANLARLEGRVALEALSRRIESFRLPPTNAFEYEPSFMLRGLRRLDVDFVAA